MSAKNRKSKIVPLNFDTYLTMIKNSVGVKMFRHDFAKVNGRQTDILRNGSFSCAFYVSSILIIFKFIKEFHTTVDSTVKDLKVSGWQEIKTPKIGSILVWEKQDFRSGAHKHIGFFVGNNKAISHSDKTKAPAIHDWRFNSKRKIEAILWNQKIKNRVT